LLRSSRIEQIDAALETDGIIAGFSDVRVGYIHLMLKRIVTNGLIGGLAGTAVMTIAENIEQRFTHRADSYVPARTAARLFRASRVDEKSLPRNWAMHWGTGAVAGIARAVMSAKGFTGLSASSVHLLLRFSTDQTLENAVGVGTPPWTWPRDLLTLDIAHKAIYAFATGAAVDALMARAPIPRLTSGERQEPVPS
jgi:hypothetical protein